MSHLNIIITGKLDLSYKKQPLNTFITTLIKFIIYAKGSNIKLNIIKIDKNTNFIILNIIIIN